MKKNTTSPKTAERYEEIEKIQKELGASLENLFELPEALHIFHNKTYLCVITVNELLIYKVPSFETELIMTHYDARHAGVEKRKKWATWFFERFEEWAKEKGLSINE